MQRFRFQKIMLNAYSDKKLHFAIGDVAKASVSHDKSILPLCVDQLSMIKNGQLLLDNISFKLTKEPITIILGANGAGKTLLLNTCHGLLQPTRGTVVWQEDDFNRVRKKQAMVFQRPVLLKRSVAANIDYALKLHGIAKKLRRKQVEQCLYLTGLESLQNRYARVLSGGEQQRLALARAWSVGPEVLFLDEPTANIDPPATAAVEQLIRTFAKKGVKIIMTTHDLNQAKRLAEEVLFLHQGRLLEQNSATHFFDHPTNPIIKAFIHGELLW